MSTEFNKYISYLEKEVAEEKNLALAAYKKRSLDVCKSYRDKSEAYIQQLESDIQKLIGDHQAQIEEGKEIITQLSIICAIHGISNYRFLIENYDSTSLMATYENLKKYSQVQIPIQFMNRVTVR